MSTAIDIEVLKKLSVADKLRIIDELWDSMEAEPPFELTPEQLAEIHRRLAEARAHPDTSLSLEELKARNRKLA